MATYQLDIKEFIIYIKNEPCVKNDTAVNSEKTLIA